MQTQPSKIMESKSQKFAPLNIALLILSLLACFKVMAASSFEIEGELIVAELAGQKIMFIKSLTGTHQINQFDTKIESCQNGVYQIQDQGDIGKNFKLLAVERCENQVGNKGLTTNTYCTEEYVPVCGQTSTSPVPVTYGNMCELNRSKAKRLFRGECQDQMNKLLLGIGNNNRLIKTNGAL